jgi:hypothetical protein
MSPEEFIASQKGKIRKHKNEGSTYIIRDVWALDSSRNLGFRLVTCQYATKNSDGKKVWVNCREGARFDEIEPFEVVG